MAVFGHTEAGPRPEQLHQFRSHENDQIRSSTDFGAWRMPFLLRVSDKSIRFRSLLRSSPCSWPLWCKLPDIWVWHSLCPKKQFLKQGFIGLSVPDRFLSNDFFWLHSPPPKNEDPRGTNLPLRSVLFSFPQPLDHRCLPGKRPFHHFRTRHKSCYPWFWLLGTLSFGRPRCLWLEPWLDEVCWMLVLFLRPYPIRR